MKAQLLLEVVLFILTVIILPMGTLFVLEPCYRYMMNSRTDKGLQEDTYIVRNEVCRGDCRVFELRERAAVDLSVVIPAYNEEQRLPVMLDATLSYFKEYATNSRISFEILVVDDHSIDGTASVVRKYTAAEVAAAEATCAEGKQCESSSSHDFYSDIRLLSLARNHGKGGAVRRGVLFSRGSYVLMVDADGATDIRDFDKVFTSLQRVETKIAKFKGTVAASFGSRAHLEEESIAKRTFVRTLLMRGFHAFVSVLITDTIKDTQCGFKLFTRSAAKFLFANLHLEGWAFDIELIHLAQIHGIPLSEVAVRWTEIEGSKLIRNKVDLVRAAVFMARDILCVRLSYLLGIWKAVEV